MPALAWFGRGANTSGSGSGLTGSQSLTTALLPGVPGSSDTCQVQSGSLYAVYQVTSLAVTSTGARRITQHEIAKSVLKLNLPGAMTFDGATPTYLPTSSSGFAISGIQPVPPDPNACLSGSNVPALAAVDAAGAAYLTNVITAPSQPRSTNYTGTDCNVSAIPCVANEGAQMAASSPDLTTIAGLKQLVSTVDSNADQRVTGANQVSNWGTATDPQIIIVRGNVTIPSGYGILVVTGTATFDGASNWNGAVLVIGDGILKKSGGGGGNTQGGMLVANINCQEEAQSPQGTRATCTPLPSTQLTPGPPYIDWDGGGSANITYNSCSLNNAGTRPLFRLISFRELTY